MERGQRVSSLAQAWGVLLPAGRPPHCLSWPRRRPALALPEQWWGPRILTARGLRV